MSFKLHAAMVSNANTVRDALGALNVSNFELRVKVSGRTLSDIDECKIEYTVCAGWSNEVKGDSVEACLEELKRRLGWHEKHQPKALAKPRTQARADAIKSEWLAEADMQPEC